MKVLFLTQYFPPEVGATQARMQHFARYLVERGHQVTIITEVPNHPKGVVFPEYRRCLLRRATEDGAEVIRIWVYTSQRKSGLRRIVFYFTYMIGATAVGLLLARKKYDVIFATSPPLPVALAALIISRIKGRPYVMDVRDLWPAVGVELGELRGGAQVKLAEWLERLLYRKAAAITAVTRSFIDHIAAEGASRQNIFLVPNGTTPETFHPQPAQETARQQLGLSDKFVVGFCGNHGIAQGLPGVLEAAHLLLNHKTVSFLFVGEGPHKQLLLDTKRDKGLDNVLLLPEVPMTEVSRYINAADVMMVPLRKAELFSAFVPSKLFDYMACAKPIVLTVDGEAREILNAAKGGIFVEPDEPQALADAILEMQASPEKLKEMGESGRQYVLQHYARDTQGEKLITILAGVCTRKP